MNLRRVVSSLLVLFAVSIVTGCASDFAGGGGAESPEASSAPQPNQAEIMNDEAVARAQRQAENDAQQRTQDQISADVTAQTNAIVQQEQNDFAAQQQLDQQVLSEQPGYTP